MYANSWDTDNVAVALLAKVPRKQNYMLSHVIWLWPIKNSPNFKYITYLAPFLS